MGCNLYLASRVAYLEGLAEVQRKELTAEMHSLEQQLDARQGRNAREIEALRQALERSSRTSFSNARSQARRESARVAKQFELQRLEQEERLAGKLGDVKDLAATNRHGLGEVRDGVEGVRGAVDSAQRDLEETAQYLTSTRSHVDELAGRIGSHAEQLERLRRRGEREVDEFRLIRSRQRSRVGDVHVRLKGVNPGRNRFTLEILADDQVIVQKDRSVNEPIEFYPAGLEEAYRIVVTDLGKHWVAGYLIRPKFSQLASN